MKYALTLMLLVSPLGCELPAPEYRYGVDLAGLEFNLYSLDMGIHPSQDVLDDPNNPFAGDGVGEEMKWTLYEGAGDVAAFYAWATVLAFGPNGEAQYYTGLTLAELWDDDQVPAEELVYVHEMAVGAFQSVLDNFPDSVTYDATGTIAYPLAPLAYQAIVNLGGTPLGGWTVVETPNGTTVIQQGE